MLSSWPAMFNCSVRLCTSEIYFAYWLVWAHISRDMIVNKNSSVRLLFISSEKLYGISVLRINGTDSICSGEVYSDFVPNIN